jgi:hypothetical protein
LIKAAKFSGDAAGCEAHSTRRSILPRRHQFPAATDRPTVDAVWDLDFRLALEHHGVHVQEELVLPDLIADLSVAATTPEFRTVEVVAV